MLKKIFLVAIGAYQRLIRPWLPKTCRFDPSCSEYARQAIARYGCSKGSYLAAARLCSCHPLSGRSGYDPLK